MENKEKPNSPIKPAEENRNLLIDLFSAMDQLNEGARQRVLGYADGLLATAALRKGKIASARRKSETPQAEAKPEQGRA